MGGCLSKGWNQTAKDPGGPHLLSASLDHVEAALLSP